MREAFETDSVGPLREAESVVRFAGLVLDLDARTLKRQSGEAIQLTRGEHAILRMFVTRPGRILSRDTLLNALANRRFEPFDRSVDVLIGRLRRKIELDPKEPRLIVTVPGEGYRFDGFAKTFQSTLTAGGQSASSPQDHAGERGPADDSKALADASAGTEREDYDPPRLSIVVLPFANIGGDPEQEYFVDGVTETLTTDLSRMQNAFVIGRGTAFTYKGKPIDAKSLGRELNVRYIFEGSVQRRGDRIRINVQLVDADSGNHLWAERFDKPVADFFDMQDEIVARLANELGSVLISTEARRSEGTPNPDSIDFIIQGLGWISRGITPENLAQARGFCERALALDQNNEMALVMTAFVDFYVATSFSSEDRTARLAAAEAAAIEALSLAPQYALAHHCLGVILGFTDRAEEGIAECQRALAIDRNFAGAHATIGFLKVLVGRAEETEAHVQEALRLSPRDTYAFEWLKFVGIAKCALGRYDERVVWLRRSIEINRNNPASHLLLAAALAALGRLEEARAAARAALTLNPQFTIAGARDCLLSARSYLVEAERILEGLRKAGVPEGDKKTNLYERAEAVSKH